MSTNRPYTRDVNIRFTLWLPVTLLEELREIARAEDCSVEDQLVFILDGWLREHGKT